MTANNSHASEDDFSRQVAETSVIVNNYNSKETDFK